MMAAVRKSLFAVAAVAALCAGCNSTPSASQAAPRARSAATSAASSGTLVHTHLAPRKTDAVPAGLHCRMTGDSPATYRPDPACTPGAVDDAVTQANIGSTICRSGYTATVRPPTSATDKVKKAMYAAYGISDGTTSELDHSISLEIGGSNSYKNLWPEPGSLPNPKDTHAENPLHDLVCARVLHGGKTPYLPLADAQRLIATDWTTAVAQAKQYMVDN